MYEVLIRSRWIIALFVIATVGSIITYVSNRPELLETAKVEAAAADPDPGEAAATSSQEPLIDKTIGEDVRPEEEKAAEAAALAAAAALAKPQTVVANGEEDQGAGEDE